MEQLYAQKKTVQAQEEAAAAQQVQEQAQQQAAMQIKADYVGALNMLLPVARENKDLVNFAYYLYKQELTAPHNHDFEEWEGIRQKVNFCNCAKWRAGDAGMNQSRLDQMYIVDMFGGDCFDILWEKKENLSQSIQNRCQYCKGNSGEGLAFCPYFFCHIVIKAAGTFGMSPEKMFNDILGDSKISVQGRAVSGISAAIPVEETQGINAKSAYGAHLLLAGNMVRARAIEDGVVHYSHVPLCRGDLKTSVITDIVSMWKTGSGVTCALNVADRNSLLYAKTEGCKKCNFEQCPHKLAAYFLYLGRKYNVNPVDLAYHVAKNATYAGLPVADNFQFEKYLEHVRKAPMKEESKAEFVKMIHFIAGRKVNTAIPFLPFNMVISSPDKEKAGEIAQDFHNALWHFDYYRRGKDNTIRKDIYISTLDFKELCSEYKNAEPGTTFVVHDIALLCENEEFQARYHMLLKIMEDRRESVISVVIGEREELTTFFAMYPVFRKKIFTKTLEMVHMDNESVMESLEDKLTQTFTIPEEVHQILDQYIRLTYPSSPKKGMEYVEELYEKLLFNHYNYDVNANSEMRRSDIPYVKPPRSEKEIFEEIDRLTGLAGVKQELRNVNNLVKFNMKMGTGNKNAVNMHMVFTGNPGTGKTTVARLTAEILYSIGFIQENKLVVCSAKDLIGEHVGQTTPKTAKKCEQAYNGVLFIDEAYQLNPYTSSQTDTYKEECIAELIQQMENNRDRLVVIFAGYTAEMQDFLNRANTGLRSRIGKVIDFPDYSAAELLEIFTNIANRAGMTLGEGVNLKALDIFQNAKKDAERFGNARFARNLYERSLLQHAAITANLDKDDPALRILKRDEITVPGN